jgi:uncharacterized protein YjbJ (UPF0337 family)
MRVKASTRRFHSCIALPGLHGLRHMCGELERVRTMDKNRVEGAKHQVKGGLKEAAGKLTGNRTKEAAGKLEKNAGKVQQDVGKAADAARRPKH